MNHQERVNYVKKEMNAGATNVEIVDSIKKLNWEDFNEELTMKQVRMIRKTKSNKSTLDLKASPNIHRALKASIKENPNFGCVEGELEANGDVYNYKIINKSR